MNRMMGMKNKMTALALAALVTIPTAFATEFTQGR